MIATAAVTEAAGESDSGGYGSGGDYGDDHGDGDGHRWLMTAGAGAPIGFGQQHRSLAASSPDITEQAAAALFCGSLTVALFALEMLTSTHRGMRENFTRLWKDGGEGGSGGAGGAYNSGGKAVLRLEIVAVVLLKLGLGLFLATLSQWLYDPKWITLAGFLIVSTLAGTRVVGWNIFHAKKKKKKKKTKEKEAKREANDKTSSAGGAGEDDTSDENLEAPPPPPVEAAMTGSSSRRSTDEFVEHSGKHSP